MSEAKNTGRSQEVERELIAVSRLDDAQLYEKYRTEAEGLNQVEAAERLEPDQRYALFVVAMNEDPNIFPANMILLYDSRRNERPVWGPYTEEFLVFAVVRDEDKDQYRSAVPRNRHMPPQGT